MKATDFFRGVYDAVGKEYFVNQAHFISMLFNAAGSLYFKVEPTKKYGSEAYQLKIFNGRRKISQAMKESFPLPIDKEGLFEFFAGYINKNNVDKVINSFEIKVNNSKNIECVNKALVEQFVLLITTDIDDVDNIMSDIYKAEILRSKNEVSKTSDKVVEQQQKWKYKIVLLDDIDEQLEMLKEEMNLLFDNETRYDVQIFACKKSIEVILESHNMDVDVYVLDVARKPSHRWQTKEFDYFGYDLYKQIVTEKPNALVKSKFYIFSRLPITTVRQEFEGADVECLQKQTHSNAEMARRVKKYIDTLFDRESKSLQKYLTNN